MSLLKGTVLHPGYYSCDGCTVKGQHRVIYEECGEHRTFDEFKAYRYYGAEKAHQREICHLLRTDIDVINEFILDPMHLVYQGVMRRIPEFTKGSKTSRISSGLIQEISTRLECCNGLLPSDFVRQPRSLEYLTLWKATEYLSFLHCTGVVILKDVLSSDAYHHFLTLSIAISLLSETDDDKRNHYLNYANELLNYFVVHAHKKGKPYSGNSQEKGEILFCKSSDEKAHKRCSKISTRQRLLLHSR